MPVSVPNVVGMGRHGAEAALDSAMLRHIARFPFSATGTGTASEQSPPAGAVVPSFTVVTVSYPSPMGPLDDTPITGPTLPAGTYEGRIASVVTGNPWGAGQGAWVAFETPMDGSLVTFTGVLYLDRAVDAPAPADRTEWMRRGAMLGLAQRAFTNNHRVRVVTTDDLLIQSIEIFA